MEESWKQNIVTLIGGHALIPETCEYVAVPGKGSLVGAVKGRDLEVLVGTN